MTQLHIIKHKAFFLSVSGTLVVAAIVCLVLFGFKPAIDFTGGTLWEVQFSNTSVSESSLSAFLVSDVHMDSPVVYRGTGDSFFIKTKPLSEDEHHTDAAALQQKFGPIQELEFQSIGPTIGAQLASKAMWAGILVLVGISLYIAFAFRKVSYPVASWKYGMVTLVTLFHDVLIPSGVLALLGHISNVEVDTNFVVALLVIMGFSVHDTIVVFDRIRENILTRKGSKEFDEIVNDSILQTLVRSVNTSLTLVLVLVAMIIFGAPNLRLFVLIMLIGTVIGTYSSIFVASPLLTIWYKFGKNKNTK